MLWPNTPQNACIFISISISGQLCSRKFEHNDDSGWCNSIIKIWAPYSCGTLQLRMSRWKSSKDIIWPKTLNKNLSLTLLPAWEKREEHIEQNRGRAWPTESDFLGGHMATFHPKVWTNSLFALVHTVPLGKSEHSITWLVVLEWEIEKMRVSEIPKNECLENEGKYAILLISL